MAREVLMAVCAVRAGISREGEERPCFAVGTLIQFERRGGISAVIRDKRCAASWDSGWCRSAVMPPSSPPRHLSNTEIRVSKLVPCLAKAGTRHSACEHQMRGLGQAGEGFRPGGRIGRETGTGDGDQPPTGRKPCERRSQVPGRRRGGAGTDIGHNREWRVHR